MYQEPKHVFKFSLFIQVLLIVGGIACLAIGCWIIKSAIRAEFVQLVGVVFGVLFLAFGMILAGTIVRGPIVKIFDKQLELSYWLGLRKKEIPFKEILKFGSVTKRDKNGNWSELKIITKGKNYTFSSQYYDDFDGLRKAINKHVKDSKWNVFQGSQNRKHWVAVICYTLFGLILIVNSIPWDFSDALTDEGEVLLIDELSRDPDIDSSSKGGRSVTFQLKKYPNYSFSVKGSDYYGVDIEGVRNHLKENDSLFLGIPTRAYQTKIARTEEPTFSEKSLNWHSIYPVQIFDKNRTYFSKSTRVVPEFNLFLFLIGIGALAYAFYYRYEKIR